MDTEFGALSLRELGGFLITGRAAIDAAEARWLEALVEFDSRCGYTIDGHRRLRVVAVAQVWPGP